MQSFHSRSSPSSKKRRTMAAGAPPPDLLPGLPHDLAILCLARVPSLSLLWRVCSSWQAMVSHSDYFHSLRSSLGFKPQQWIYALLHNPQENALQNSPVVAESAHTAAFSWHAYDPISNCWHCLPSLPFPIDFHLSSPSVRGFLHSVQCASSLTKLFMVAGSRRGRNEKGINDIKGLSLEPALECPLIFDTQTQEWTQGAPFGVPRRWCACGTTAAGKLMVASGCGRDWDMASSKLAEMYDSEVRKWFKSEYLKTSTFSRMAISMVNYKGKLHMVSSVGVIYDPMTGKWGDMPRGMKDGWSGQSVVVDERLLMLEESSGRLKVYEEGKDEWKCVVKEEEMLKNMEQLAGGVTGTFFGIVRAAPKGSARLESERQRDVIRIVDVRNLKPVVTDLPVPFGQIVALQVLSRTFNMVQ